MSKTKKHMLSVLLGALLLTAWGEREPRVPEVRPCYARIDIRDMGYRALEKLKADDRVHWWVEVRDSLLIRADRGALPVPRAEVLPVRVNDRNLVVISAHHDDLQLLEGTVLAQSSRYSVVLLHAEPDVEQLDTLFHGGHGCHSRWFAFQPDTALGCRAENLPPRQKAAKRADVEALIGQLDGQRWFNDLYKLHCLSRNSFSSDIEIARDYLADEFRSLGLSVTLQDFPNGSTTNQNVIATLTGTERPEDIYIIGAHYDSISNIDGGTADNAPGAEDNASGTAGVLELARVLAANPPAATVVFIGFSGEEQFLVGSFYYVNQIVAAGEQDTIKAALTMDMIAYTSDQVYDITLESNADNQDLLNLFADAATNYTTLETSFFLSPSGSDHVPFINSDIPALLVIQDEWFSYPGYHRTTDLAENLGIEQGLEVLKMHLAVLEGLVY
ncbi:MAG: M28 family peptidase [Acidobacteriota bacterium]|nr:M28 family peptidase [Acidobacteriota bacterium]